MPVLGPLSTALEAGAELLISQTHHAVLQLQVVVPTGSLLTDAQSGFKGRKEGAMK